MREETEIKFVQCVICNKKEPFADDIEDFDFGVDIDELEADKDGGVRGEHLSCRARRCPICHSYKVIKFGKKLGRQRYGCNECGHVFLEKPT